MPVYMIQAGGECGPVKIGHSSDPEARLGQLQVSHWETLRIIRTFAGDAAEEASLHEMFDDLHIRGEWHSFSKSMMGDIGLDEIVAEAPMLPPAPTEISGPSATEIGSRIAALRASWGYTQTYLAEQLGVSRSSIASIERGHDLPGRELLWKTCKFFQVPFVEFVKSKKESA